jgi:hypothetical protein
MAPLDSLKALLDDGFVGYPGDPAADAPTAMTRTLHVLRQARDRRNEGAPPPAAVQALFALRLGAPAADFRALKQLCANAAKAAGWDTRRLIEDRRLFPALLEQVATLHADPRRFGKCYRALLASYFGYPACSPEASSAGRSNWQALGLFLRHHLDAVCTAAPPGRWASTLRDNAQLLDNPPPAEIDAPDAEHRATIRRQLGIPTSGGLFTSVAASCETRA